MHNHHQHVCEHVLKYCKPCDTVYCGQCSKEWYKSSYSFAIGGTTTISAGTGLMGTATTGSNTLTPSTIGTNTPVTTEHKHI